MGSHRICLVRAPHSYKYNDLDVAEEAILTYAMGYFKAVGFDDYQVFDFHLQRNLELHAITSEGYACYILAVRETGEQIHYINRLVSAILLKTKASIILYGQTARLRKFSWDARVRIVKHDEIELAKAIGISTDGPKFGAGLLAEPYFDRIGLSDAQKRRFKASLETTRGCLYKCRFCFINAGDNYESRWKTRPPVDILADIETYISKGIKAVAFHDSEFLGPYSADQELKRELLESLAELPKKIVYMIWARADTLLQFNEFDLLKRSGLVNVFIGAESFHQPDLRQLGKGLKATDTLRCIAELRKRSIYTYLSFIVFNRNTTVDSLKSNISILKELYSDNPRFLGLPYFTFSFESDWEGNINSKSLSGTTYIENDVMMKSQPNRKGVCFNPELEPLVEVCRLMTYEWSKKATQLNHARDVATLENRKAIEDWFQNLGLFCVTKKEELLQRYSTGKLNLISLSDEKDKLFADIFGFYRRFLPERLAKLATFDSHASKLEYNSPSHIVEDDEYWSKQIPSFEDLSGIQL